MAIETTWKQLTFPDQLPESVLNGIVTGVRTISTLVTTALEIAAAALETAAIFLLETVDPIAALIDQLVQEITELVSGIKDTGIKLTHILPTYAKRNSLAQELSQLSASILDKYDPNRPITAIDSTVEESIAMVVLTARVGDLSSLEYLYEIFGALVNLTPLENLIKNYEINELPVLFPGQSRMPDWSSATLADAIPAVGALLQKLEELLYIYVKPLDLTAMVEKLAQILRIKAQLIDVLAQELEGLIEAYLQLIGYGLDALIIFGSATAQQLSAAIVSSVATMPRITSSGVVAYNDGVADTTARVAIDDIGALLAFCATGPSAPSILLSFFGV